MSPPAPPSWLLYPESLVLLCSYLQSSHLTQPVRLWRLPPDPVARLIYVGAQTWVRLPNLCLPIPSSHLFPNVSRLWRRVQWLLGELSGRVEQLWHAPRVFYEFGNVSRDSWNGHCSIWTDVAGTPLPSAHTVPSCLSAPLSVHPLVPPTPPHPLPDVPPSPRLWVWLHMCCPRRSVMLASWQLRFLSQRITWPWLPAATSVQRHPRPSDLSLQVAGGGGCGGGALSDFRRLLQRHKAYSGFTSAEPDRFSERCKSHCLWGNAETRRRDARCAAELGSVSVFGDLMRE